MKKIAVFVNKDSQLCDFFEAEQFLVYERSQTGWSKASETVFTKIKPSTPALTRKSAETLLPHIKNENCGIIAGGALMGIPYSVFDRAGLCIFTIDEISDRVFDEIIEEIEQAESEVAAKGEVIQNAKPAETSVPGEYVLDLVALQSRYPEVTSKQAMREFLESASYTKLTLKCRHIPPWIENDGRYDIKPVDGEALAPRDNAQSDCVEVVITRKCDS